MYIEREKRIVLKYVKRFKKLGCLLRNSDLLTFIFIICFKTGIFIKLTGMCFPEGLMAFKLTVFLI